jgi:hypothetical protein
MSLPAQDVVVFIQSEVDRRLTERLQNEKLQPMAVWKRWVIGGGAVSLAVGAYSLYSWVESVIDSKIVARTHSYELQLQEDVKINIAKAAGEAASPAISVVLDKVRLAIQTAGEADNYLAKAKESRDIAEASAKSASVSATTARAAADAASTSVIQQVDKIVKEAYQEGSVLQKSILSLCEPTLASLASEVALLRKKMSEHVASELGTVAAWPIDAYVPQGWHICDGAVLDYADCPDLAKTIGANGKVYLPDFRGQFLRGASVSEGGLKEKLGLANEQAGSATGSTVTRIHWIIRVR